MPTVAVSPSTRTHSCSFEYRRSSGTLLTLRTPLIKGDLHDFSGDVAVADADREVGADLRELRRNVGERDVLLHRGTERTAGHLADDGSVFFVRGKEASFPFYPAEPPVDAGIVGIVDSWTVER